MLVFGRLCSAQGDNLMPQPASLVRQEGRLEINGGFRVALEGYLEPRLQKAGSRLVDRLAQQTGIPMDSALSTDPAQATLIIHCERAGEPVQSVREDESYRLVITSRQARLEAATPVGILRGLATFLQWVNLDRGGFSAPAVTIQDKPRFPWRGLMIDVSRRWIPKDVIERNIEGMAAVKLNVLHWHLSDDQGFRIESRRFPKLHEMGSDGLYYTQDEIREVVAYARDRGIRVVPEFDMPGHATSWFVGYPEIASQPGPYTIERKLKICDPAMDPTREEVFSFLDSFIAEMAQLFPDEYFHIGGDEVNGKAWNENADIQEFMRQHGMKDHRDLQAYFNQRLLPIIQKYGRKMVGWDEILHPGLPKDIVVQSWRGQQSLADAARRGYMGILSTGYYLDLMQPASLHYGVDPLGDGAAGLSKSEQDRILGGEACVWTENIDAENIDAADWPRTAAIAERLWSASDVKNVDSMYRRLAVESRQLEWLDLKHRTISRKMLEREVDGADNTPLERLDEVLAPLNCDIRRRVHHYTSLTPLNRLVDATPPESDRAREFAGLVEHWTANKQQIRAQLSLWKENHAKVVPVLQGSALLQEALPLADDVSAVATAGIEALDYLESGKRAPKAWVTQQTALLDRAGKPEAELWIMIVPPVRKLVEAAQAEK
jgi:hexosaminidase